MFDALPSDRVYRQAFPVGMTFEMLREERSTHFDPEILDAFMGALPDIEEIRRAYRD